MGRRKFHVIRFLLIALAVVALTIVVGSYLNGPPSVFDPECSDPTLPTAQAVRHCPRPTSTWERISKGAPW
jgi:hypothetical protein